MIDKTDKTNHYNEEYFEWQKKVGAFGGKANLFKFEDFIEQSSDILDFGCGGGYLLNSIVTNGNKYGVEINPIAREEAEKYGIICYSDIYSVPDNLVDVIISNHALEHVDNPSEYIKQMKRILRNGGRMVLVVPHEVSARINCEDVNMHLYTWSPQNFYNLLKFNQVEIEMVERIYHAWPHKHFFLIQRIFGWRMFHIICRFYAHFKHQYQVRAIGIVNKG